MKSPVILAIAALFAGLVLAQTHPSPLSVPWSEPLERATKLIQQGQFREGIKSYDALLNTEPIAANAELRAFILHETVDAEIQLGDDAEAERRAREALSGLVSCRREHTAAFALAEGALAEALRAQSKYFDAKARVQHAVSLGTEILGPTHPAVGIIQTTLIGILQETGDLRRAEDTCRQVISIFERAGEPYRIQLGTAYQGLAVVEASRKKPKAALDALRRALAQWSPDHPFVIYALGTEMLLYRDLKRFHEAEQIIPDTLARCLSRFGPDHPARVVVWSNAAAVYFAEGKYQDAERLLRDSLPAARKCFPAGHPTLVALLSSYFEVLNRLHRTEEAARFRAESQVVSASALATTSR